MTHPAAGILLAGRIIFALFFLVSAWGHLTRGQMMVAYAKQMRFPASFLASWPAGVWLAAGALSVALGVWADLGALMLAVFVTLAAWGFHRFWEVEDPQQRQLQRQSFLRNVLIVGAALAFFAFFTTAGHNLPLTITGPLFDLR